MSDIDVFAGDRVFLTTPDGRQIKVQFGVSSVEVMATKTGTKLVTTYSSEIAIAVGVKDKPVEKMHPCGCFGTECRGGFGHE